MAAGLKDISRMAGVSVAAVSDILNRGREHLYALETRQRVVACSQWLEYRPNRSAQAMRSRKSRIIGFVSPTIMADGQLFNFGVFPFMVGLSRQLAGVGYHVAMLDYCAKEEGPDQEIRPWTLDERFFDGLVVHYGMSDRSSRFTSNLDVPVIWWDSGCFAEHGCIYRDERQVGQELTRQLIQMGHRRIAITVAQHVWQAYQDRTGSFHYSFQQRLDGYREEMQAHGLEAKIITGYEPEALARQLAEHATTALITQAPLDAVAGAAHRLGWEIPQDLTVASPDRETRMPVLGRQVAGMLYDRFEVGQKAAQMLVDALAKGIKAVPSVRLAGKFDPGDTLARPRARK